MGKTKQIKESLIKGPLKDLETKNNIKGFFSIFHDLKYRFEDTPRRLRVYIKEDEFTCLAIAGFIKFYYKKLENIDIKFICNLKEKCFKFPLNQRITFEDTRRNVYYGIQEPNGFDESKAQEIKLSEFLKNCRLDIEFLRYLAEDPEEFTFYKMIGVKQTIFYYSYQGLETFYIHPSIM